MSNQRIVVFDQPEGKHNREERYEAWAKLGLYRNLSTVWVTPTRGTCATRVAFNWMHIMGGFNSALAKLCVEGYEVGKAYNEAVSLILSTPSLAKFQYMLTVEEDNTAPPDGLIKLYESIQDYDAVGGLYWTKGEGGVPMIWGDPKEPNTYVPQVPIKETVQQCNGLGMGFTLFRLDMFRNPGFQHGQWFKTVGEAGNVMTQDLYFFKRAAELGYKCASDNRVRCGHYDLEAGVLW
jgi:hypothetical protein